MAVTPVRTRRVFYIPGYDPIHPRRYRELYRTESAKQAAISGYDITLKPKSIKGGFGWRTEASMDGSVTETEFEVLVWSDIVKGSMEQGITQTYLQLVRTAWAYIAPGVLWRLMRLRRGPVIAALYPIIFLTLQLILALALAGVVGWGLSFLHPWASVLGLAVVWPVLAWFKKKDAKFFAYYLMHDYAYSARTGGAYSPELVARMAEFGDRIAAAAETDVDEVLVVGHSSGAHLGVSVLAELLRAGRIAPGRVAFLSLGQVVPMVSFLKDAHQLRRDLAEMGSQDVIPWVDVTAPGDGATFALCDPVAVSGVAGPDTRWPLVFSAAFSESLSPEFHKSLRWRFFRRHFQYMCAFDRPRDYDYFRITAGPLRLWDRYGKRKASKSRIEAAVSKFTSLAA
ncbi:hypothetical protein [Pseudaestuariivita atlantica]|uniref:Uncharacterized protein n=1 Tax=Pseudaestuariivita atlantica TaxID=1317121 RepID=A0A0L1JNX3_9RHOB|nr:hypothetical protein [Pseudaestuariivita atlantica]KNG93118.1 hypothetical protein ATO11_14540 [Pseudaestuariivita atlantica]